VAHGGGNKKPCSVEGCSTFAQSRGLCGKHGGCTGCRKEETVDTSCNLDPLEIQARSLLLTLLLLLVSLAFAGAVLVPILGPASRLIA
jgi:hypothetical protein